MICEDEDDSRLSDNNSDSDYNSDYFLNTENFQTNCSSVSNCDEDIKTDIDSDISDDENSDNNKEWLQNQEKEHSPEYYLQLIASLDTFKFWQLRYSSNTQTRLD